MVIGKGLVAKAFLKEYKNDDDVVVFASGVSNSNENRESEFKREQDLLELTLENNPNALFIYFSTYSLGDPDAIKRPYVLHKKAMENIVKCQRRFLILRVSNVVGENGNPNTIIKFFVNKIISDELITVWKLAQRNLIDIEDLFKITNNLIRNKIENKILLVTNPYNNYVSDIVSQIADFKCKNPKLEIIEKGVDFDMKPSVEVLESIDNLKLNFDEKYLMKLLNKYY